LLRLRLRRAEEQLRAELQRYDDLKHQIKTW
jgi:hypothetical protein